MRALDFLTEAGLAATSLRKNEGKYLLKLIQKIQAEEPITTLDGDVYFDEQEADRLLRMFFINGDSENVNLDNNNSIIPPADLPKIITLHTTDGREIATGRIIKTAEFKDKKASYVTIGDISEIALALALYVRFNKQGQPITTKDFMAVGQSISVGPGKEHSSTGLITGNIRWSVGKQDVLHFRSVLSSLSMNYFVDVCSGTIKPDNKTNIVIASCIKFANEADMVTKAIEYCRVNKETNLVDITCDGVSDQKGTKADLHLNIDGKTINLLSLKVDKSQLGQASGHDFKKQVDFFRDMFGVDITPYSGTWGKTYQDHFYCIANVWEQVTDNIIQKVSGDNTQREMQIIRSMVNGIIKYSGGEQDEKTVIVKLTAKPSGKAYQILRIDQKLHQALDEVNLVVEPVNNGAGVKILGVYRNQTALLIQARSYKSDSGKVFRTIIEGGNLLDVLSAISDVKDNEREQNTAQPVKTTTPQPKAKPNLAMPTKKPA